MANEDSPLQGWPMTEQEERLEFIFNELTTFFKKLKKQKNPDKVHGMIKEINLKLKEAKGLIKEFEMDARADGMPAPMLAERKRDLVNRINGFIATKKAITEEQAGKNALLAGASQPAEQNLQEMSMVQLIRQGHKEIDEIDQGLDRAERIAQDTLDIGTQAAQGLNDQTEKLNKIVDDLNEIEFTMKKATKVISDITRGLLTDKCIGFLLVLVGLGVIAAVVLTVVKPNFNKISAAAGINVTNITSQITSGITTGLSGLGNLANSTANSANNAAGLSSGRRRMMMMNVANNLTKKASYALHHNLTTSTGVQDH
ncbi:hypothetical protein CEUSTIGMA_g6933.t1 [Chlamydomonas eustigma]|uniref:t-SNARE coiled-coil homology domain-containing protein n=1 Tax=Chlamydomonas eustigma TaxID=1157962 RepID=A0A250X9C1_9CHLO|nr:hypothetical protein CEUSTIGMA_g6933.t1 [Chlamydomonas eustigma]|eukprot:GAX79492.1 hypothetical protein CEUSTIGMA_g6933.t1 [Chlamydomonas eustigma]